MTTLLKPEVSVSHRYSEMSSDEFITNLNNTWLALDDVKRIITEHVKQGNLQPIDGIRGFSALSANILGYEEFVPRSTMSPVLSSQ